MENKMEMVYEILCAKAKMWSGRDDSCRFAYENAAAIVREALDGNEEILREIYAANVKD